MFFTYKSEEKNGERDITVGVLSPSSQQIVYISISARPTNYFLSFKLSVRAVPLSPSRRLSKVKGD
jgi:hypothetical protein